MDICGVEEQSILAWSTATTPAFVKQEQDLEYEARLGSRVPDKRGSWEGTVWRKRGGVHLSVKASQTLFTAFQTFQPFMGCMPSKRSDLLRESAPTHAQRTSCRLLTEQPWLP